MTPLSQQTFRDRSFSLTVPLKTSGLRAIDVIGHQILTRLYEGEGARDIVENDYVRAKAVYEVS